MDARILAYLQRSIAAGACGVLDMDRWAADRLTKAPGGRTLTSSLYADHATWCMGRKIWLGHRRAFSDWLVANRYQLGRGTNGASVVHGVALKP